MSSPEPTPTDSVQTERVPAGWIERIILTRFEKALSSGISGRLVVTFPSGGRVVLGDASGPEANLELRSLRPILRLMSRGSLGLAESYMCGEIDTPDLRGVLVFLRQNYERIYSAGGGLMRSRLLDRIWHRRRDNSRSGSRKNIKAHYDLGNDFYAAWLDPGMTYSSGIYRDHGSTLDEAQREKYRVVLEALRPASDERILEIGCGWGGMTEAIAARGATVRGITVSRAQQHYAAKRIEDAACTGKAEIVFEDYRDVSGQFDGIVSVEMIEAVGEAHWPNYFKVLSDRLRPGGRAVIQAITIDEPYFDAYRRQTDFIQRYIFPGGMLPTVSAMRDMAAAHGLAFATVERFGSSYARTLEEWQRSFHASWPKVRTMGLDQRFRRMWDLYLMYCEVGFDHGDIDVGIYTFTKPELA